MLKGENKMRLIKFLDMLIMIRIEIYRLNRFYDVGELLIVNDIT